MRYYISRSMGPVYSVHNFKVSPGVSYCSSPATDNNYFWGFYFRHNTNTLTLKFFSDQDEMPTEESCGIRSIKLFLLDCGGLGCWSCKTFQIVNVSCHSSLLQVCPDGTFDNKDGVSCIPCHNTCESCFNSLKTGCKSCSSTYLYVSSAGVNQTCVDKCPDGLYNNDGPPRIFSPCHSSCSTCSADLYNNCLTCNNGPYLHLFSNECRTLCPDGTYSDASKICQACNYRCIKCTSSTYS
jgi:hypothetical protein